MPTFILKSNNYSKQQVNKGVNVLSIQRRSKWQQHPKKIREVEAYEGRKEFWDSLSIPKRRIIQAEPNHPHKKKKGRTPATLKITAYRETDIRDGRRCQHPGCYKTNTDHHHIIYRSAGGKNHVENLVTLCSGTSHDWEEKPSSVSGNGEDSGRAGQKRDILLIGPRSAKVNR